MEKSKASSDDFLYYNNMERYLATGFQAVHDEYIFDRGMLNVLCEICTVNQEITTTNPPESEVTPMKLRERLRLTQYYLLSRVNSNTDATKDKVSQACCLGVLLYVGIIQKEFLVSPLSKHFIWKLKVCLQKENWATEAMCVLRLWILFLAGPLVFDPIERPWFINAVLETISQISLLDWCESKLVLETFAWAGEIQDNDGRDLWDEAMRMQNPPKG
jgi:hypothetical protein